MIDADADRAAGAAPRRDPACWCSRRPLFGGDVCAAGGAGRPHRACWRPSLAPVVGRAGQPSSLRPVPGARGRPRGARSASRWRCRIRVLVAGAELGGHLTGFQLGLSYAARHRSRRAACATTSWPRSTGSLAAAHPSSASTRTTICCGRSQRPTRRSRSASGAVGRGARRTGGALLGLVFVLGVRLAAPVVVVLLIVGGRAWALLPRVAPTLNLMITAAPVRAADRSAGPGARHARCCPTCWRGRCRRRSTLGARTAAAVRTDHGRRSHREAHSQAPQGRQRQTGRSRAAATSSTRSDLRLGADRHGLLGAVDDGRARHEPGQRHRADRRRARSRDHAGRSGRPGHRRGRAGGLAGGAARGRCAVATALATHGAGGCHPGDRSPASRHVAPQSSQGRQAAGAVAGRTRIS